MRIADLSLTKTDIPDPVSVGAVLIYRLVVSNDGPSVATGVELIDELPAEVTFDSVVTTQGSSAPSALWASERRRRWRSR